MRGKRPCALPAQVYASRWMEAQAEGKGPPPLSVGFTYELTAGIVDKSKSLAEIAKEEVCRPAYGSSAAAPLGISCECGKIIIISTACTSGTWPLCHILLFPGLSASADQYHSRKAVRLPKR